MTGPRVGNLGTILRLLAQRNYRIYAIGSAISLVGSWMQRITVGWLAWELTQSGTWLGVIVFADMFPVLVFGVFAGAIADRVNLLRQLKVTQVVGLLQAALLAAMHYFGVLEIVGLFVISLALGVNSAFYQAARLTIVPSLVSQQDLGPAIAFNSIIFNLARFLGPAAAGFVIAAAGLTWGFVCNALSYLAFVVALAMIPSGIATRPSRKDRQSLGRDMREGIRYALSSPPILSALIITVMIGLCARPVVELLPGFANVMFGRGAEGLAALTAAVGVGAIAGSGWMMQRATRPGLAMVYSVCSLGSAASIAAFVGLTSFTLALVAMACLGFFMVAAGIAGQTLINLTTDRAILGRVMSLWGVLQRGAPALGSLAIGAAFDWIGLGLATAIAAGLLAVVSLGSLLLERRSRRHEV